MSRTWFITGAGRGLGRAFVEAALGRGDRVVATARDPRRLSDLSGAGLVVLPLDVTDAEAAGAAVRTAAEHFDGLGPLAVTQAALPLLRARGHGHLVQISSLGGLVALPLAGAYVASKWALEGLSEALAQEVAGFGVRVSIVEPGSFATDQGRSATSSAAALEAYQPLRDAVAARPEHPAGDPADAAAALLRLVDAADPPLRAVLGPGGTAFVRQVYERRLAQLDDAERLLYGS